MNKVWTIMKKEWAEVFKNRLVLFSVAFLPLIFIALPVATMYFTEGATGEGGEPFNADEFAGFATICEGLNEYECSQLYMLNIYTLMFMILPAAIPVTIAAYSIVGEKTARSLEPLLATPITTLELLTGKGLAAIIPAVVATWLSYLIYFVAMRLMIGPVAFDYLLDPLWLIAIFIVGPLMTLLAVSVAVMVSSRVSDPRVAEQLSMVVMLPIIVGIVGQSVGLILIDRTVVLLVAVALLFLDALLVYFTLQAFQRETILTRWK